MSTTFYAGMFSTQNPNRLEFIDEESLMLNLSGSNASHVIRALGFQVQEGPSMEEVEIDCFANRCSSYLRNHLGNPDPEVPGYVDRAPGKATVYSFGRDEGYLMDRIHRLAQLAREGKARGATHIYAG